MASNIVKSADLRNQSDDELGQFLRDKTDELLKLRFQFATGQLENVARMGQVKREIARAKTIQGERARHTASAAK